MTAFDGPGTGVTPMLFLDGTVVPLLDTTEAASVRGRPSPPRRAHPRTSTTLRLAGAWDLDGDGVYETPGQTVSYRPTRARNPPWRCFPLVDSFGGVHVETTEVTVR